MKHLGFIFASLTVLMSAVFVRTTLSAAPNEHLSNGSFEEGFTMDGIGLNWGTFFSAGPQMIGYYEDAWKSVVYDGQYSQLIEFDIAPATPTPIFSATPSLTNTPPRTSTFTPTATRTNTSTLTPTSTSTNTPTHTSTLTPTPTSPSTSTFTPTSTRTSTSTPTGTLTPATSTPTRTIIPPTPVPPFSVLHPKGLAVDLDRNYLYVTSRNTNSVVVIDEVPFTRIATITGFDRPFDVGVVKRNAYISEFADGKVGQVGVINMDTLTKTMTINTASCGNNPTHIDVNLITNRVYVTLHGSAKTAVIDANTNTMVGCVDSGAGVFGTAVSMRYNQFFVTNRDTNDLWAYDGATNQLKLKIDLGGSPYYVAVSPDGTRLYVAVGAPNPSIVDQLYVFEISPDNLFMIGKVKIGNAYDGGWILESQCTGQVYVSATGLLPDGVTSGSPDRQVWVFNHDLTLNRVLTAADGIGNQPFGLTENPKLGRIYVGAKGADIVTPINEPACGVSSLVARNQAPLSTASRTASLQGRVAGMYQTMALVQGTQYTLTLHAMFRLNPYDVNVAKDVYTAQWAIDPNGGTDWTMVADWKPLPWTTVYPKLNPGSYLDYTTTFTAPSNKATLFLRFIKKHGTEGYELDVNLDGLSVTGASPEDTVAPSANVISVPAFPIDGKSYLVRARASDDIGVTQIVLADNGSVVDTRTSGVGILDRATEFVWTPRGAGKHTLQVIARDAAGKSSSVSQEVNVGAYAEFIKNGDFEDGFAANGVANSWGSSNQGGDLFLRFAYLDATWSSVVLNASHAQTLRVSSPGLLIWSPAGESAICQTVSGLTPGAQYWLTMNGMLHVSDNVSRPSDFANGVQWGYAPGSVANCSSSSVNNWQTVPWSNVTYHVAPGRYNAFATDFIAPWDTLTLFVRISKNWPIGKFELDLNLDQLSLKGYK